MRRAFVVEAVLKNSYSPTRALCDAKRHIAAALATFRDSASPLMGIITKASQAAISSSLIPCASFPKTHAWV